jgi:hypothetical protein
MRMTHDTPVRVEIVGGASRDRTDDLRVANATLSQLSYGPVCLLDPSPVSALLDVDPN